MAIIYSYPYVSTVNNSDTLVISVSDTTADNGFLTKSLTADNLASYVTARVNLNFLGDTGAGVVNLDTQNLSITGTANEIETAASSQTLQIGLPDSVTITDDLTVGQGVSGSITVGDSGSQSSIAGFLNLDEVFVNDMLEVDGDTILNNDLDVSGNAEIGGSLNMTLSRINNVLNPTQPQDAATKQYVDSLVSGGLSFKGSFRADSGLILSGANSGSYLYNCPGGAGTRVSVRTGDYYIVANAGGQFYCSGDLLNVGDSIIAVADAAADSSTVNDWATLESDNIDGTGLANTVPLWTDSQVLGNSNITQNPGGSITISENLLVDQKEIEAGTMIINGVAEITGELDKANSKIIGLADPTAAQDAATKAYVDAGNTGQVTGTGTTQTLPVWSDGPAGALSDSAVTQIVDGGGNVTGVRIFNLPGNNYFFGGNEFSSSDFNFKSNGLSGGFYRSGNFRFENNLAVGRTNDPLIARLDVGTSADSIPAAFFRNGVVVSNNPAGVQVDNTSMVIGAGNNDNVTGSDHCLIVGSGNQITSNSDQSVAFGQGNTITSSIDSLAVGNSNTISSAQRTYALGFSNDISSASSFVAGGDNTVGSGNTKIVLGYNNSSTGNDTFVIGNELTGADGTMVLGYRNRPADYPTPDKNQGLGETKLVIAVGSGTNAPAKNNAIIITEGGVNGGNSGTVPQVPRVILPTVVDFNFADDTAAAAGGIPVGGLYHNAGALRIRLT